MLYLNTVFFGWVFNYIEEFTYKEVTLLTAIVSMTDPVAIGRLLRTTLTPRKFHTLLEGESHFTDASAMIIFLVALRCIEDPLESKND